MHKEVTIPELTDVVGRLAALLGPREGGVAILEGGITNRNFRVNFGGTAYVVRLPGKRTELLGIDRESERMATKAAAELGIAPSVAALIERPSCLVTSFVHGRVMSSEELRQPDILRTLGRNLRAFHDSGIALPSTFDPLQLAGSYAVSAREQGVEPPPELEDARKLAAEIQRALAGQAEAAPAPCHNDLLCSNFLFDGKRVSLIDWEYAGMGHRYFDLGNFAVNNALTDADEELLLSAYLDATPTPKQRATVKVLRYVSDLREGMWGVIQSAVSKLDFDFTGYARAHFDRLAETGSQPEFRGWIEQAGGR